MAHMYPADGPAQDTWSFGERQLYDVLRRDLCDDYHVIHSTPWRARSNSGRMRTGEADFVIIHPQHGILVLEVKGGAISVEGRTKRWYTRKLRGNTREKAHRIKDPFRQGQDSMHVQRDYCSVQRRLDSRRTLVSTEGGAHDNRDDGCCSCQCDEPQWVYRPDHPV
jgi:Nuclease-related domain